MITGNPKKMAVDIAAGYLTISVARLKGVPVAEIRVLLQNMMIVARELRAEQIPLENIPALKQRNMKLSRLNNTETMIRAWCKKRRIPI